MRQSVKKYVIGIFASFTVFAGMLLVLTSMNIDSVFVKQLLTVLAVLSLGILLSMTVLLLICIWENRSLPKDGFPYNFKYTEEYKIFRRIPKIKKDRFSKTLGKRGITIPNKYSVWKKDLLSRYKNLVDNEDFYHYMKHNLRAAKHMCESTLAILVPIEVGIMTIVMTIYSNRTDSVFYAVIAALEISFFILVDYARSKTESCFVSDVMDILCPGIKEDKKDKDV